VKLIALIQVYNEVENGNLERCLESVSRYCDAIQVYDDGSTDNPRSLYDKYGCDVLWGAENDFKNELGHKQAQLDCCKAMGADWIWRIDADEVIERLGEDGGVRALCETTEHDSWAFHMVNMWRSPSFYRVDLGYNDVVFNRLWRVPEDGLHFNVQRGLHLVNYPVGATDNEGFTDLQILHYVQGWLEASV
jgi:glycosyltransferase involved in cell wall biosynthesis